MATEIYARVGARIKAIRKQKDWSQQRVAQAMGVGPDYISKVENGKKHPSVDWLEDLATEFGVHITAFFVDEAPQPPSPLPASVVGALRNLTPDEQRLVARIADVVHEDRKPYKRRAHPAPKPRPARSR